MIPIQEMMNPSDLARKIINNGGDIYDLMDAFGLDEEEAIRMYNKYKDNRSEEISIKPYKVIEISRYFDEEEQRDEALSDIRSELSEMDIGDYFRISDSQRSGKYYGTYYKQAINRYVCKGNLNGEDYTEVETTKSIMREVSVMGLYNIIVEFYKGENI